MRKNQRRRARPVADRPVLDPNAERAFIEEWEEDVQRAAARGAIRSGRPGDADDFAQEARWRLVTVARRRGISAVPYLRTVIANAVLAASLRLREQLSLEEFDDERAPTPIRAHTDPRDQMAIDHVVEWTEKLPARLQRVYRILYREHRSQREAAAILRVSQPRVAQMHRELLNRGRRDLQVLAA